MTDAIRTLSLLFASAIIAEVLGGCSPTIRVINANSTPPVQASGEIPANARLDIGIQPLNPHIPARREEFEFELVVPDVRRAESRYIPYHLRDTLAFTGNWGAVRVIPEETNTVDLTVTGKIIASDGEQLIVHIRAEDATGRVWLDKKYSDHASKFSYEDTKEDPFQDLYNDICDELLMYRKQLNENELAAIHRVADLKYARNLSPDAFGDYLKRTPDGRIEIARLPAKNDAMMERVARIKDKEYLFLDTMDDHYGQFYRNMKPSYDEWRSATYDDALMLRRMKRQAKQRLLVGSTALVLGGVYGGHIAGAAAIVGGVYAIEAGVKTNKSAKIHEASLKELNRSLGSEITPFVLDIEGRVIELTGTVEGQYKQWRETLREIYAEKRTVSIVQSAR